MLTLKTKSLKIPKGQSKSVHRRTTDNTMAKERVQKDKQRITKHTYKTEDRVTRRVTSSCSSSGIRRVNLVTNPVITLTLLKHYQMKYGTFVVLVAW